MRLTKRIWLCYAQPHEEYMPKRTKKQKLRAQGRHQLPVQPLSTPIIFQFQSSVKIDTKQSENVQELMAIREDLFRTIVLAIVIIGIELSVYWRFFR